MTIHQHEKLNAAQHDRLVDALIRHHRAGRSGEALRRAVLTEVPEPSEQAWRLAIDVAVARITSGKPERD